MVDEIYQGHNVISGRTLEKAWKDRHQANLHLEVTWVLFIGNFWRPSQLYTLLWKDLFLAWLPLNAISRGCCQTICYGFGEQSCPETSAKVKWSQVSWNCPRRVESDCCQTPLQVAAAWLSAVAFSTNSSRSFCGGSQIWGELTLPKKSRTRGAESFCIALRPQKSPS